MSQLTTSVIQKLENLQVRAEPLPDFRAGDTVRVQVKIREGEKERLQAFEGVVLKRAKQRSLVRACFTVRKISYGVGVERVFPENSPNVANVEVLARGKVRQGRLYYLRDLSGKAARIKERAYDRTKAAAEAQRAVDASGEAARTKTQVKKERKSKRTEAKAESKTKTPKAKTPKAKSTKAKASKK